MADNLIPNKNATNAGGQDKQSVLFVVLPHGQLGFRNGNLSWVVGVTPLITLKLGFVNVYLTPGQLT